MKYSFTPDSAINETYDDAVRHVKTRRELADALSCNTRALREFASRIFVEIASEKPELLVEFEADIIDSLHRPEPMTRYNALAMLLALLENDSKIVDRVRQSGDDIDPLEDCLFDEESGQVRMGAFKILSRYGGTTATRSEKVWPLLSEAVRCYHGDSEFVPMLNELINMLGAKAAPTVRQEAGDLFCFDAENGHGLLQKKAAAIAALAPNPPRMKEKIVPVSDDDEEEVAVVIPD